MVFYYTSTVLLLAHLTFILSGIRKSSICLDEKQPKLLLFNYCFFVFMNIRLHYQNQTLINVRPIPEPFKLNSRNSLFFLLLFLTFLI
jgi:hypothetical protein